MAGVEQGKPHKPGAGRPRLSASETLRVTVTLPADLVDRLRRLGDGNVSAGIRVLAAAAYPD